MDIDAMWDKIKKGLKDGAALSMEKIEEYTKIGKLKIDEFSAKRKLERNYVDIGERAYELVTDGKGSEIEKDILVGSAIENIKGLKEELVVIEKKIRDVSEEHKKYPDSDEEEAAGV